MPTIPVVTASSYLTLHYRLATQDGRDIVTTFGSNPATLEFGQGQLAPFLETCLLGLPEGTRQTFELTPERAFGARNPELVQRVSRAALERHTEQRAAYQVGDLVEFAAPDGSQFAGMLYELDEDGALFDFNHPLAGQTLQFEVQIIGIL